VEPRGKPRTARRWFFELAGDGAFDGPVAGIVDARGHFIGEELALMFETFDGEDADVFQRFENSVSGFFPRRAGWRDRGAGRGGEREAEGAVEVVVLDERVNGAFAIARTDRKNGEFASEGDKTPRGSVLREAARTWLSGRPARCEESTDLCRRTPYEMFLGPREGRAFLRAFRRVRRDSKHGEFGSGDAEFAEKILLGEAVLRGFESGGWRIDGNALGQKIGGFHGNVFSNS